MEIEMYDDDEDGDEFGPVDHTVGCWPCLDEGIVECAACEGYGCDRDSHRCVACSGYGKLACPNC